MLCFIFLSPFHVLCFSYSLFCLFVYSSVRIAHLANRPYLCISPVNGALLKSVLID